LKRNAGRDKPVPLPASQIFTYFAAPVSDQSRARFVEVVKMKSSKKTNTTKTVKGEQTKALILSTALEMLHERGYEATTMRAIAEKAGVSLGNAYHYFGSKDHLIQAFYHRIHEDHLQASLPALQKESSLKARLLSVMAAQDRNDGAVSRICRRAIPDGGRSAQPTQSFRPRVGSSAARQH
jgi:AcrR family transcriptional regulator